MLMQHPQVSMGTQSKSIMTVTVQTEPIQMTQSSPRALDPHWQGTFPWSKSYGHLGVLRSAWDTQGPPMPDTAQQGPSVPLHAMLCHAGSHLEAAAAVTGVGATTGLSVPSRAGRLAAPEDEAADAGLLFLYAAVREGTGM